MKQVRGSGINCSLAQISPPVVLGTRSPQSLYITTTAERGSFATNLSSIKSENSAILLFKMPAATQEAPAAQQQMALPSDVVSQQPVSLLGASPHPASSLTISLYHRQQSLSRNLSLDFVAERRRDARCAAASALAMRCVAEGGKTSLDASTTLKH